MFEIEKIFMLSVVIETFKKSVMFISTPFANRCLVYSDWALYQVTLHLLISQTRRDSKCADHLIGIRDSPDHRSVRNKEVNYVYMNVLSRAEI